MGRKQGARAAALLAACGLLLLATGSRDGCIPVEPEPVECEENGDCSLDEAQYCAKGEGDCDGVGLCEPRPEGCYEIYAPVCGCDGETYPNDCYAAAAGVNVLHEGECPVPHCWSNDMCAEDEYCLFDACAAETGVCEPRPGACPYLWEPVCGCDGRTYPNACVAGMSGVSVDYPGECAPAPSPCEEAGGMCVGATADGGDPCPPGYAMVDLPCNEPATDPTLFPVCCMPTPPRPCLDNSECLVSSDSAPQFCAKRPGDCDGEGLCETRPVMCPDVWDPVCGCDGVTYGNPCEAAAAGVNVLHEGECAPEPSPCEEAGGMCVPMPPDGTYPCPPGYAMVDLPCVDTATDPALYEVCCMAVPPQRCEHNTDCLGSADEAPQYCAKEPGDCDAVGVCETRPVMCPQVWAPVCGCDGATYGNACEAAASGVNVLHEGECEPVPSPCEEAGGFCVEAYPDWMDPCPPGYAMVDLSCEGPSLVPPMHAVCCMPAPPRPCESNRDCVTATGATTEFCAKEPGDCDGVGLCEARPVMCPDVWAPVCGCDGETYGNSCEAAAAGVSVLHEGQCGAPHCWSNDMCADAEYCFFHVCAAETGVCELRPEACPRLWQPVCGCDGNTYPNACLAAMAGASVDYRGECRPPHCWSNDMCPADEYCFFEVCAAETGVCEPQPEMCPTLWDPVCGCDGRTYANSCVAAMAGVSVDYRGECRPVQRPCEDAGGMCVPRNPDQYDPCPEGTAMVDLACDYYAIALEMVCCMPVEPRPCQTNADCLTATDRAPRYCAKEMSDCGGEGVCELRPQLCPDVWAPVCGCDCQSWGNACEAAAAGVNVLHTGECWCSTDP